MITGIGSLPHVDLSEAVRFVLETTDVPYLPQLPVRDKAEAMLPQWGDGLCGCGRSDNELGLAYGNPPGNRNEAFAGAEAMLLALPPETRRIKTQVTGPVTLALGLLAAGHSGDGLFDCIVEGLGRRVEDHAVAIGNHLPDAEIVLIFDEPGLTGLDSSGFPINHGEARGLLNDVLQSAPVPAGVHCCGPTDWAMLADLHPAWLSWDIDALGPSFFDSSEVIAAAIAGGTRVIWGAVPVQMGSPGRDLLARLQRVIGTLVIGGAEMVALTSEALYAPACGLAGLTVGQAEIVSQTVRQVVGELAETWAT